MKKTILFILFVLLSSLSYADITTNCTNVVALYHFDGNADDAYATNHGTLMGGLTCDVAGKVGNACNLDGNDDYITLSNALGSYSDFTITGWIKMNSNASTEENGNNAFFGKDSSNYILLRSNWFLPKFNSISGSGMTNSNIDNWIHLVIVRNGTNAKMYRNTSVAVDWDVGLNPIDFSSSLIGNQGNYFFNGLIDEVIIYNKALNQSEITELYNSGNGVSVSCGAVTPECNNGIDDDGDGLTDFSGGDTGCTDANDNDETDCGDNICETGIEFCDVCVVDCEVCPAPVCGDTNCDLGETCLVDSCCNGNIYNTTTQLCCSSSVFNGDCCIDSDCTPDICSNYFCIAPPTCIDSDNDGYNTTSGGSCGNVIDCDDRINGTDGISGNADDGANINPGATEICNDEFDNDCDGFCDAVGTICTDGSTAGDSDCGSGNVITAASCSYADVSSAISSASSGDTVQVPAGTCTWDQTLTINKGITLQGAGIDVTIISSGTAAGLIEYRADSYSRTNNIPIRITGFTLDANFNGENIELKANNLVEHVAQVITNNRIDHNKLIDGTDACVQFGWSGSGRYWGLIDNNEFIDCWTAVRIYDANRYPWDQPAYNTIDTGSADGVVIEGNTMDWTGAREPGNILSAGHGMRYTFRFNTLTGIQDSTTWIEGLDVHGNVGALNGNCNTCDEYTYYGCCIDDNSGVMSAEIYYNNFTVNPGNTGQFRVIGAHGGTDRFFYNNINDNSASVLLTLDDYSGTVDTTYPMHITNTYVFKNIDMPSTEISVSSTGVTHNTDYWELDASFDGTSGMGVGTRSQMDAITTCIENVGFWVTDEGTWNTLTPETDGKLYRCDNNNTWTEWYTPLEYPHPLRTGNTLPVPTCNDVDKDGYGNPASNDCTYPDLDCNDNDAAINPNAIELCNLNVDDNCDLDIQCNKADDNPIDGCVMESEVDAFVQRWFVSSQDVSMSQLISAIRVWKAGC